ncbi:MAG: phosphoglucosamine mutase [Bacillota bacterium]|nr:phosphoglucosamine mutase [Bacillota bacterium]
MGKLFGTDGVRGIANSELTVELAYKLGRAGAHTLTSEVHKPRILIGKDTRVSGDMLESALCAGVCSVGAEAVMAGIIPTPGVAYLARKYEMDAGIVISASHNTVEYNGIKFFDGNGFKLPDAVEERIENIILHNAEKIPLPTGIDVGRCVHQKNAAQDYIEFLIGAAPAKFKKLKIVLDCANGAASSIAPVVFEELKAAVIPYYSECDGANINKNCGSTHPQRLQQLVREHGADIGLAFDGDADRLIAVDEGGVLVDGDKIMAICALDMMKHGTLKKNTLVTTVMSNFGLDITLLQAGCSIIKTNVGDRYVLEEMLSGGFNLGGEQSGHIIFLDENTTGDGMLTAIKLLSIMVSKRKALSELGSIVKILPQVLVNARITAKNKDAYTKDQQIMDKISALESKYDGNGRVLIRSSGTEPLVRVMIEGADKREIEHDAAELACLIEEKLN